MLSIKQSKSKPKVAFLGPQGSYSHLAAQKCFKNRPINLLPVQEVERVFKKVSSKIAKFGIVPVENTAAGSIEKVMDLFARDRLKVKIAQEVFLKINFHFLGHEQKLSRIKKIFAHPMAQAQCSKWLKQKNFQDKIAHSKSNSHSCIEAKKNQTSGAISNRLSATLYGLKILESNIENLKNNITRFFVLAQQDQIKPTYRCKTSFLIVIKNQPGSLYNLIKAIAKRKINMTKIESRIMKKGGWDYYFFIDIQGHRKQPNVREAIKEMRQNCEKLKILGSYPQGKAPWDED
ncbi:MAG: prephenate dehydratase [Candidatus Moranbacteria bacterium]|nr:prephenate dehydratase [Candidatus Moranbacteria bacterium]